jgi:hypothetical protein
MLSVAKVVEVRSLLTTPMNSLADGSDFHDLGFFFSDNSVHFGDGLIRRLLNQFLSLVQVVLGNLFFLFHFLEHLIGVASVIPYLNLEFFSHLLHELGQFFPSVRGQGRQDYPNDLAVI